MRLRTAALASGAALLLAGCSSASGSGGPAAATADGTYDPAAVGPLQRYFTGTAKSNEQQRDDRTRRYEAVTAACMKAAGFDYKVTDPAAIDNSAQVDALDAAVTDEAQLRRAAKNGYLITTYDAGPAEQYVDPNEASVAAMSDGQRTAYNETLNGSKPTEADSNALINAETGGCRGKATEEVDGGDPLATAAFASLGEDVARFYDAQAKDSGRLALAARWADCMADKGFAGYSTLEDARADISAQDAALFAALPEGQDVPDETAYAELTKVEIATAVADAECQRDVDYLAAAQRLRFAAEQEFVDDHRTELDAMLAARGGSR